MTTNGYDNIQELYTALKEKWQLQKPVWDDISLFVGIGLDPDYLRFNNQSKAAQPLDTYVEDPTAAISVNQAGDYTLGIMWGTGDKVFKMKPSRYVKQLVDESEVNKFFDFATEQALYHMNHESAGLSTSLRPYVYDQFSFGTSGVGAFLNKSFINRIDENALLFRSFGVDNTVIDEGKGGQVDIVFAMYHWRVNRIISEFGKTNGVVDKQKTAKIPKPIMDAFNSGNFNEEFNIVFGFYPREDYEPKLKGKRGTRYKGVWFMDDQKNNECFFEEDFADRPVAMARAIKVRGEVYGRASGTMLISTIRSVNFMVGTTIEIVEKMANPSLGLFNNAIFGDSVLDTSPDGLTIFNQALAQAAGGKPVFPLYDVGDPSKIMEFLVPYFNGKVTTGFKVDDLLDFSSAKEMTATESMQRYAIRGKSLAGFLLQQKNELLVPLAKRCISLLMSIGELGANPNTNKVLADRLMKGNRSEQVIPDAVLQVMADGRPWYELEWNNELEKLVRTETVQNLVQLIQAITAIAALYPDIIHAIDWYKLLKDINENLDYNTQIIISEKDFKAQVEGAAKQRAMAMQAQIGQMGAATAKDASVAKKNTTEAVNGQAQ